MDLIKQYITQCIVAAANNLRLNTEKIEIVALLREYICKTEDLEKSLKELKKTTELSTFAIRLNEIYNYIAKSKIDFLKVSDKFKEHCHYLVRDLNFLLDKTSPQNLNVILHKVEEDIKENDSVLYETGNILQVELNQQNSDPDQIPGNGEIEFQSPIDQLNEAVDSISETENIQEDFFFEDFEEKIINPIKQLDSLLKNLANGSVDPKSLDEYYELMLKNSRLAEKAGFEIIANMHRIFAAGLKLILSGVLEPQKEVIESLRACLIVIVAVVRGKEVDITSYLNMAEEFGKYIINI